MWSWGCCLMNEYHNRIFVPINIEVTKTPWDNHLKSIDHLKALIIGKQGYMIQSLSNQHWKAHWIPMSTHFWAYCSCYLYSAFVRAKTPVLAGAYKIRLVWSGKDRVISNAAGYPVDKLDKKCLLALICSPVSHFSVRRWVLGLQSGNQRTLYPSLSRRDIISSNHDNLMHEHPAVSVFRFYSTCIFGPQCITEYQSDTSFRLWFHLAESEGPDYRLEVPKAKHWIEAMIVKTNEFFFLFSLWTLMTKKVGKSGIFNSLLNFVLCVLGKF